MTDDTCDAETTSGEPCQNPAGEDGSCWIPSHSDPDAENPGGRPSKLTDERREAALEAARDGKSKAGCARAAGVSDSTLLDWVDTHDEFRSAFRRARAAGETELLRGGLTDDDVDSSMAKFLLSTSFGYVKTERHEVDADVTHDGDLLAEFE